MSSNIVVPALGESVTEATVAKWMKQQGESIAADEALVELETDKVTLEVFAPSAGVLSEIRVAEGQTVEVGAVLGVIGDGAGTAKAVPTAKPAAAPAAAPAKAPAAAPAKAPAAAAEAGPLSPAVRKLIEENKLDTAALLTTFNEVDMTNVMALRAHHKDSFEKKHGVKLGFMSFFVKAAIVALKEIPAVNGEIDGDDVIYKNHYDIGVAVGTPQGLVVPVVRDADALSFADIEKKISELGMKARDGKLTIEDLTGGTFTISNGGVYGSLMSTPILNPPQSGILGMHKIQPRPMAVGDKIEIRPMMYLALSYDHRIIDGREAVTFLVRIKDCIEDPQRILLDM